jgi:hypothetical protein
MGLTLMMPAAVAGRTAAQYTPPLWLANPWRPWREHVPVTLRIALSTPSAMPVEDALHDHEDAERWDGMG